jgi:predicted MPP superfamily phosphohydrolase
MEDFNWINAALLLLLVAGHTEILVALINRVHATRLPCGTLRQLRHLHDVLIPGFPLVVLWFVGFGGPRLLLDGSWSALSTGWGLYFAICSLGVIGLLYSTVRHLTSRRPALVMANDSRIVDVAQECNGRPLGDGPFRWLTRVPGNQQFQIEVAVKELRLPRLPAAWDVLTITHLSDWHLIGTLDRPFFERASGLVGELNSDLVVFTGDLLDRQSLTSWLPETLGTIRAPLGCHYILGNHDWYLEAASIRRAMGDCGWIDATRRVATCLHKGGTLAIGGDERPWMGHAPDFSGGDRDTFRILLSHTPDNLAWARAHNIDLMLSGHNHGGQVVLPVIGPIYSPSLSGCKYAAGSFWEPPTFLHVSRGLSGRHPLRINCRPEVTQLVLRASRRVG